MHPDLLIAIGQRIHSLRTKKGISQDDLALDAGFHRTYVGALERGERNATALSLLKVADALGVTLRDLVPPGNFSSRRAR